MIAELEAHEIRSLLRRGDVDPRLRRELESELAWRAHSGERGNRPREFLPAFLLVDPAERRQ